MLANHPSSAKFISKKIAVRFVNDDPSQKLIDKMSNTFTRTKGDISEVLLTMVSSTEFWNKDALREKTKSPFDLAISAARSLNAEIIQPYQLFTWINKMGQKIYSYRAPTGFPDKGQYWINTGSLLNRMNFGLALASQRIPGIRVNLPAMNKNREPESSEAAMAAYGKMIMPERDLSQTIDRLKPMLNDPDLQRKIEDAASKNAVLQDKAPMLEQEAVRLDMPKEKQMVHASVKRNDGEVQTVPGSNTMLAQVVGIILGSPEF